MLFRNEERCAAVGAFFPKTAGESDGSGFFAAVAPCMSNGSFLTSLLLEGELPVSTSLTGECTGDDEVVFLSGLPVEGSRPVGLDFFGVPPSSTDAVLLAPLAERIGFGGAPLEKRSLFES